MKSTKNENLSTLSEKIVQYGKENLEDILYVLTEAVQTITRQRRCRIYLEDLTRGQLVFAEPSVRLRMPIRLPLRA